MNKSQLHKRFTDDQVKVVFEAYLTKEITSPIARGMLEIGKTRFFRLINEYQKNPESFTLQKERKNNHRRISLTAEQAIIKELKIEQGLIENRNIPIRSYNYSSIQDTLSEKKKISVSVPTIIRRAKDQGYYIERKKRKKLHDREVITNFPGELIQHDASLHQFSPYIPKKLSLITSLDDHSRLMLFADIFERETTWYHISALEHVFLKHGCPLKYYADQHAIFRFVRNRDKNSVWCEKKKGTDDISPQWKQVLQSCGVGLTYALSPQAKGKIERPYRWIQDRLVRTAAREQITDINELRKVLKDLIHKYNTKWIHSTTKEIPIIRFERAINGQRGLFKPLELKPGQTHQDIFCLKIQRRVDAYRKISLDGVDIRVPNGTPRETVNIHIVPNVEKHLVILRFWQGTTFLGEQIAKPEDIKRVRF